MWQILRKKAEMPTADRALPGRPSPGFEIPTEHFVNRHRIQAPFPAGLEQAMFETNLGHGFTTLFEAIGWGPDMARKLSLNSVDGSWLDESDKSALRIAFRKEIAALDKEFSYATAALPV